MVWSWKLGSGVAVLCVLAAVGCGGGGDDDDEEARKPDTGVGAAQVVPATRTCVDLCSREGECFEALCNEDTKSTRYDGIGDFFADICAGQCDDSLIQSKVTEANWQCLFQSSCRQAFDYDSCHAQGTYSCQ